MMDQPKNYTLKNAGLNTTQCCVNMGQRTHDEFFSTNNV